MCRLHSVLPDWHCSKGFALAMKLIRSAVLEDCLLGRLLDWREEGRSGGFLELRLFWSFGSLEDLKVHVDERQHEH